MEFLFLGSTNGEMKLNENCRKKFSEKFFTYQEEYDMDALSHLILNVMWYSA